MWDVYIVSAPPQSKVVFHFTSDLIISCFAYFYLNFLHFWRLFCFDKFNVLLVVVRRQKLPSVFEGITVGLLVFFALCWT